MFSYDNFLHGAKSFLRKCQFENDRYFDFVGHHAISKVGESLGLLRAKCWLVHMDYSIEFRELLAILTESKNMSGT